MQNDSVFVSIGEHDAEAGDGANQLFRHNVDYLYMDSETESPEGKEPSISPSKRSFNRSQSMNDVTKLAQRCAKP